MTAYVPYAPLNMLKSFAEDIWIVDGPEIGFHYLGLTFPFPTRMTVVRLRGGELWVHSPIAWDKALAATISQLGEIRHLVAPNTLHHSYLAVWHSHFPRARTYGPPGLREEISRRLNFDETLGPEAPTGWGGALEQCIVPGALLTEVVFLHRASDTLIVTDLIENFEPARVNSSLLRWIMRLFGAVDPDGKAPIDMQWSFRKTRREVRTAVGRMISWAPHRIIVAHGRCYTANGQAELKRAFRWAR